MVEANIFCFYPLKGERNHINSNSMAGFVVSDNIKAPYLRYKHLDDHWNVMEWSWKGS